MAANAQIPGYAKTLMAIAAVFMPVFLILPFLFWGNEGNDINLAEQDIQRGRLAPVGRLTIASDVAATDTATAAAFDPEATYNSVCAACHATGVLNAPKFGEHAPWQAKVDERGSIDALIQQGIQGLNAMPPKGGATISDENFATTVKYMLAHSGFDVEYASGEQTASADSAASETAPAENSTENATESTTEAAPAESTPETTPAENASEAKPAESTAETAPAESASESTTEAAPAENASETKPAESASEAKPAESASESTTEAAPAESTPEAKPAESASESTSEAAPTESTPETKPAENTSETKPAETPSAS